MTFARFVCDPCVRVRLGQLRIDVHMHAVVLAVAIQITVRRTAGTRVDLAEIGSRPTAHRCREVVGRVTILIASQSGSCNGGERPASPT